MAHGATGYLEALVLGSIFQYGGCEHSDFNRSSPRKWNLSRNCIRAASLATEQRFVMADICSSLPRRSHLESSEAEPMLLVCIFNLPGLRGTKQSHTHTSLYGSKKSLLLSCFHIWDIEWISIPWKLPTLGKSGYVRKRLSDSHSVFPEIHGLGLIFGMDPRHNMS